MAPAAEKFTLREICERDDWTCHICGELVDVNADRFRDDWAPTLDHVIPVTAGGSHARANVKLAHRFCNSVKSDKPLEVARQILGCEAA